MLEYAKLNFESVRAYALLGVVPPVVTQASICECVLGVFHFGLCISDTKLSGIDLES